MASAPQDLDPPGRARRRPSLAGRVRRAWKVLTSEQRLAVGCAAALFVTMFLPWYEKDVDALVDGRLVNRHDTLTAFGAFSFVEAAVLLVAAGIIVLFFARGEGKRFHLPGGDGLVTLAAGAWVCFLIFVRQIDKPNAQSAGDQVSATVGVQWGIFVAFLAGLALAYAGFRLREAHVAEPGEEPTQRERRRRSSAERGRAERPARPPREPRVGREPRAEPAAEAAPRPAWAAEPEPWEDGAGRPGVQGEPRVARGPLADPHGAPTTVRDDRSRQPEGAGDATAPLSSARRPEDLDGPESDGGEQLTFDERE